MREYVTIELVGRTSYWRRRIRADGGGAIWAAWLRHPTHGTVGIYMPDDQVGDASLLPDRKLVSVRGIVAPLRAGALEDDPRREDDRSVTPVVVAVQHIDLWDRVTAPAPIIPQEVRVRPPRPISGGYIAQSAVTPDLCYFAPSMRAHGGGLTWDHLHGVLVPVGRKRFLRYVLADLQDLPRTPCTIASPPADLAAVL